MFQKILIMFFFILAFHTFSEVQAQNKSAIFNEDFIGTWKGEGKIIVAWCEQKHLSFELQIGTNGIVSGKIGDAQIRSGKLRINNFLHRWLGNKEFRIDIKLIKLSY